MIFTIVLSIILFLLSMGSFVIAFRQFKEKGFLFNNAYIYAADEERNRMNKKPYYRQSALVFFALGMIFFGISLSIIFNLSRAYEIIILSSVLLMIYAIVSTIQIMKNSIEK